MVAGLPSVISVTGIFIKSSELVVATTSFPGPTVVVVVIGNEIEVDLVSAVFVSLSVCFVCSDLTTDCSSSV